jgi:gluconolactonase
MGTLHSSLEKVGSFILIAKEQNFPKEVNMNIIFRKPGTYFFIVLKLLLANIFLFCFQLNAQEKSIRLSGDFFDSTGLVSSNATLKRLDKVFSFTEGPAVDKKGNIYFTDQPNDQIWKYDIKGRLSVFMKGTGRSNGLYFTRGGKLLACADLKDELWSINQRRKIKVLIRDYNGKRLNGPNDLWVGPGGGIYFTDPYYQRSYWTRTAPEIEAQRIYYVAPGTHKAMIADSSLTKPNGIVGSKDGQFLFVADIGAWKTYKFTIAEDGSLMNRQLFINQGADGITLDSRGNLYLSGKGVTVYNAAGTKIAYIPVPAEWVANLCFGGKDRRVLFITAGESVYTLRMQASGIE